jgi:hypothetical protein
MVEDGVQTGDGAHTVVAESPRRARVFSSYVVQQVVSARAGLALASHRGRVRKT